MSEKIIINATEKTENLITTYMERSLHASLKSHFCPDSSFHEVKIGRFVADVCYNNTIFEIQTAKLGNLSKKLRFYIEKTDFQVVIVCPLAKNRKILWLDENSGELVKAPRMSSKHENLSSGIADLLYLKEFLGNERLSFCFVSMEIDEVRLLDGYGKQKKIRATSVDRVAGEIYSIDYINNIYEVKNAIFPLLPDAEFDREMLSKSLKLKGRKLWAIQKLLLETGLMSERKEGRKLIFNKIQK
jgi:hypothetical protein